MPDLDYMAMPYPTTQEQVEIVDVNATAVLEVTLEGARALISAGKRGTVMNVSSAADRLVFPGIAVYAATKAFVTMLSQSLDFELSPYGVRVLTTCPGVVDTQFRSRASGIPHSTHSAMAMDPKTAANHIWQQVNRRKRLQIFDCKTRLGVRLARMLPTFWVAPILARSSKKCKHRVP